MPHNLDQQSLRYIPIPVIWNCCFSTLRMRVRKDTSGCRSRQSHLEIPDPNEHGFLRCWFRLGNTYGNGFPDILNGLFDGFAIASTFLRNGAFDNKHPIIILFNYYRKVLFQGVISFEKVLLSTCPIYDSCKAEQCSLRYRLNFAPAIRFRLTPDSDA
jgi:hypothetical protein